MRFKILWLTFIIMACISGFFPFVVAQELESVPVQKKEEFSGVIDELNYETGVVLLKSYQDVSMEEYREDTIFVPKDARIEKDNNVIKFADLLVGQKITVSCEVDVNGRREATHILVESE